MGVERRACSGQIEVGGSEGRRVGARPQSMPRHDDEPRSRLHVLLRWLSLLSRRTGTTSMEAVCSRDASAHGTSGGCRGGVGRAVGRRTGPIEGEVLLEQQGEEGKAGRPGKPACPRRSVGRRPCPRPRSETRGVHDSASVRCTPAAGHANFTGSACEPVSRRTRPWTPPNCHFPSRSCRVTRTLRAFPARAGSSAIVICG
jgi:hypothetical protein